MKEKKKGGAKRKALIALCIVLALILALLIVATIYAESLLSLIGRVDKDNEGSMTPEEYQQWLNSQTEDKNATGETIDPDDIIWGNNTTPIEKEEHIYNFMLIGQDRRAGEGRQRSDSMILCTVDTKTATLTMTSFMRDMYVQIPGYYDDKMNACYQIGGMKLLDECLEVNFGVQVDANVEVDFGGFIEIIDLIGGIDIELNRSEANYLNRRGNWDVDNSTAGTWSLKEGMNHLTGEQALAYSRIRYIGNADFERTDRQRRVLTTVLDSFRDLSIPQLNSLLWKIMPMLTTDMTNADIIAYAMELLPLLRGLTINTQRIPADGTFKFANIKGVSMIVPDLEANRKLLEEAMAIGTDPQE